VEGEGAFDHGRYLPQSASDRDLSSWSRTHQDARLICALRLLSDDEVHDCALFQRDRIAHGIDQGVSNTNSLTRIVSALNGNLNFLGVARNRSLMIFSTMPGKLIA
jgi:hypothetical protein